MDAHTCGWALASTHSPTSSKHLAMACEVDPDQIGSALTGGSLLHEADHGLTHRLSNVHVGLGVVAVVPAGATTRLRENGTCFEFSLCSSRACLGKIMLFIYKWRKKCRFLTSERMIFARSRTVMLPPSPTVTLALVSPRKTRSVRNLLSRAVVEPPLPRKRSAL